MVIIPRVYNPCAIMILMAPANRKDPKRSTASESDYSLMEFMRHFPDDEACLRWLWRTRCETGEPNHAHCPRCEEIREFKRYETKQQRQSVDLHRLRPSLAPHGGDDLREVVHVAAPLVLRHVADDQHSVRHLR